MTTFVHVGQCGNQIAEQLWLRAEEYCGTHPDAEPFLFTPRRFPRAVFVDSEPKVLAGLQRSLRSVHEEQVCAAQYGR